MMEMEGSYVRGYEIKEAFRYRTSPPSRLRGASDDGILIVAG